MQKNTIKTLLTQKEKIHWSFLHLTFSLSFPPHSAFSTPSLPPRHHQLRLTPPLTRHFPPTNIPVTILWFLFMDTEFYRPSNPHFFVPLIPASLKKSSIPDAFMMKYLGGINEKDAKIAKLKDKTQKIWNIKMSLDGRHFEDGWQQFCKDHDLKIGDILVFKYLGYALVFHVTIYGNTCCDGLENHVENGHRKRPRDNDDALLNPSGYPHFQFTVMRSNLTTGVIRVPLKFAKENKLLNRWCDVEIMDVKGRSMKRKFRRSRTVKDGNHFICCRPSFYSDYDIKQGDELLLHLISNGPTPIFKFYIIKTIREDDDEDVWTLLNNGD